MSSSVNDSILTLIKILIYDTKMDLMGQCYKTFFLNPHFYRSGGSFQGRQWAQTLTPANSTQVSSKQSFDRNIKLPGQAFLKASLSEKSLVDGVAIRCKHVLVATSARTPHSSYQLYSMLYTQSSKIGKYLAKTWRVQ